jgi:uncharacterized membrane protein YedE/YeeE
MALIHEIVAQHALPVAAVSGVLLGLAFGALVHLTGFCAMGGISDWVLLGDSRRLRAWFLAGGVALIATQVFVAAGAVDLAGSPHLTPSVPWLAHLVGGGSLGVGMVLAGGCPSRSLVRAGTGDVRALTVVITVGVVAAMVLSGWLAGARTVLAEAWPVGVATPTQSLGSVLAANFGIGQGVTTTVLTMTLAGWAGVACFSDQKFARSPRFVVSSVGIGLTVAAGWAITGLASDEFSLAPVRPVSLSFVGPIAGVWDWFIGVLSQPLPRFTVAAVFGTLAGGAIAAVATGTWRFTGFAGRHDVLRAFLGAALMGFGGGAAGGCTIGQGVTGIATLSIGSFVTMAGLLGGGALGVRLLELWSDFED